MYRSQCRTDIASRVQFPLLLAFALTVHKAQGMSLPRVQVDCSGMTTPGQLGVAIGRATSKSGLRVLNFRRDLVSRHPTSVYDFSQTDSIPFNQNLSCCKTEIPIHVDELDTIIDIDVPTCEWGGNVDCLCELETEGEISDCDIDVDLSSQEGRFDPPSVDEIMQAVEGHKYAVPKTEMQGDLNECLDYMLSNDKGTTYFSQCVWGFLHDIFQPLTSKQDNPKPKEVTQLAKQLNSLLCSNKYKRLVAKLFHVEQASSVNFRACFNLVTSLRLKLLKKLVEPIKVKAAEAAKQATKHHVGSEGGRAKQRYIAGWCIAKLKFKRQETIRRNLYKKGSLATITKVSEELQHLTHLMSSHSSLQQTSTDANSLSYIEMRQNKRQSLTNVSDAAFDYFRKLDAHIIALETRENMVLHGKQLYTFIETELINDETLKFDFHQLYSTKDEGIYSVIDGIFVEIIQRYINMSAGQLRREYIRELKAEKEEAHRKQIRMTKSKFVNKFNMSSIVHDTTEQKVASHHRLLYEMQTNKDYFMVTYTVNELKMLCSAYDITCPPRIKKANIIALLQAIEACSGMPKPQMLGMSSEHLSPSSSTTYDSQLQSTSDRSETDPDLPCTSRPTGDKTGSKRVHLNDETDSVTMVTMNTCNETEAETISTSGEYETMSTSTNTTTTTTSPSTTALESTQAATCSSTLSATLSPLPPKRKKKAARKSETVNWPCGVCGINCICDSVCCDKCQNWYHFWCIGLHGESEELGEEQWFCQHCYPNEKEE